MKRVLLGSPILELPLADLSVMGSSFDFFRDLTEPLETPLRAPSQH